MSGVSIWARKGRIMIHGVSIIDAASQVESAYSLPLSPRMSYGQMRMALYQVAPDLHVASARLPGRLDGVYCLATNTVLIDRRITYTRKRCALVHELVHWQHGDDTSNGCRGGKLEQRCRRETAILLINPAEYALAERMYDGNPYQIAAELNVTIQII